ncbi:MAG TPA: DUF3828 domain-containing protein [Terriglobia bacterium]|nr:DUF3828 domain-containing protein [Terriglobia bacterium]
MKSYATAKSYITALAALAVSLWLGRPAVAECLGPDPVAAAKAFYENHADFYYTDPGKLQDIIAPRLLKLLTTDYACSDGQECALDSDPWLDAQDGDIAEPITYDLVYNANGRAAVVMHYIFALSEADRTPQQVTLQWQRRQQCWQIEDMITPRGRSLADEIDTWFRVNGDEDAAPPE